MKTSQTGSSAPAVQVLNIGDHDKVAKSAIDASKDLQKMMLRMKGEFMEANGSGVRYADLKNSALYGQYKTQAATLRDVDLTTLSENDKMAFFINVYNALTIHGLSECPELPKSVLNVQLFWKRTAYNIAGLVFSLDDIEHGILRSNRPHPAARGPPFAADDPRVKYVMQKFDPRVHFALVCGAKSCPSINVYSSDNIERALQAATVGFCKQEVRLYEMRKEIRVSRLFQWYRADFGQNDVEAVRWTIPYLASDEQRIMKKLIRQLENEGMVDLCYSEYDWSLNKV